MDLKQVSDQKQKQFSVLQPSRFLEPAEQPIICPQREAQCPGLVELRVRLEVLDDVREEVSALHAAAWRLKAQISEVDVQVVVGGLVMQVDPQLAVWKVVAPQNGLLHHNTDTLSLIRGASCFPAHTQEALQTHLSFLEDVLQQRKVLWR